MVDTTDPLTDPADPLVGQELSRESSLSNWAGPYVTEMLGKGWALADMPYQQYQGPLTAGPSQLQSQAFQGLGNLVVPQGMMTAADTAGQVAERAGGMNYDPTQFQTGMFNTQAAQQYMNPYLQSALNPQIEEARRQAEIQRIKDAGRLTSAGAFGGSRQAIMESEGNRNLMDELSQITGTGYRDAYDRAANMFTSDQARRLQADQASEQSRQFGATQGLSALAQQLAGAQAQGSLSQDQLQSQMDLLNTQGIMGGIQRGIESEGLAADKAAFDEEWQFPYKQVQFMQSLLNGMPLAAQNYTYQEPGVISELAGTAGGIMSIFNDLFGAGESDSTPTGNDAQTNATLGILREVGAI
ncbi:MAG: hypothetical protein RLZZ602_1582 [Pseudomonadota bacterium]|jgi:hypothetical protein